jgi:hypothetical protein
MWSGTKSLAALSELENGSDRTIGIVAGAIVDFYLTEALKKELKAEDTKESKEIQAFVFQPDGPLGNFGPKISVAYLA